MPMLEWMGMEGWLLMAAWIVVIAVIVWALVRDPHRSSGDEAIGILRARLARGEITDDEFTRALALLNQPLNPEGSR